MAILRIDLHIVEEIGFRDGAFNDCIRKKLVHKLF